MSSSNVLENIYLSDSLVQIDLNANTDLDVLKQLSELLIKNGVVKTSFRQAIQNREREFPTGLPFENIGVAIPHTDTEHVITQSLAIGILKNPVKFRVMGGDIDDFVDVKIIFMLAIKEPHQQIEFLQSIVNLMQNHQKLSELLSLSDSKKIISSFKKMLTNE